MRWKDEPWVITDVETSGLDHSVDRVIEIGFCRVEARRVVERVGWLIDPGPDLPALPVEITEVTGLRIGDLRGQPCFAERAAAVGQRLSAAAVVIAYNAPFDHGFIRAEMARAGRSLDGREWNEAWIDPLVQVREFDRYQRGKRLTDAAARRGLVVEGAHRAAADAEMTARLQLSLLDRLPDDLEELVALQEGWRRAQEAEYLAYRARNAGGRTAAFAAGPKPVGGGGSPSAAAVGGAGARAAAEAAGGSALQVYTARAAPSDPDVIDVSRRIAGADGAPFAPSDELLRAFGSGTEGDGAIDGRAFAAAYLDEMRVSWRRNRAAWDALLRRRRIVLVCRCDAGVPCHRRILAEQVLVKLGAIDRGELPG